MALPEVRLNSPSGLPAVGMGLGVWGSKTIIYRLTIGNETKWVELPFRPACFRHGAGGERKQDNNKKPMALPAVRLTSPSGLPAVGMGSGGERKHDNNRSLPCS